MKYKYIMVVLLISACQQVVKEKNGTAKKVQEIEMVQKKVDTIETYQKQIAFNSVLRADEPVVFNKIYTDTIEFNDYNDDFDYWHLKGFKNDKGVSLVYNWDWHNNEDYDFRQGNLIVVQWKLDSIFMAGDEEVVEIVERALDAKKIASGNQPVQFLKRKEVYDESVQAMVSNLVINQAFINNITEPERAAIAYTAFDIGNECEWGYDSEGNGRVLWCHIPTTLNLGYQCSDTQLNFLQKWFAKDTLALKKLKRCRTIPNTATVQTSFDEILIQKDEPRKTITVQYKVTGINTRASESWYYAQTDVFEYGLEHIVLVDSKKTDLTEGETNMNPDAAENIDPQNFVLALKDHILNEWKKQDNFDTLKISFINNVLNIQGNEGFTLSNYNFNEMVINGTEDPQVLYLTIGNEAGGGGGNVILDETYILTVLDAENFHIKREKTKLTD